MPKFSYVVKDSTGATNQGIAEAYDQASLIERLQKQGFFIVSVSEVTRNLLGVDDKKEKSTFTHKRVTLTDLLTFAQQLATMLEAGVTLLRSLDVIGSQVQSSELARILKVVQADVEQGSSLSAALGHHPKVFNQFWTSLIEVGEASGTMPTVLNRLTSYLEQQDRFQSTVISALIYPAILFLVAMGVLSFFALFVGPRFQKIFHNMGAELPMITIILLTSFEIIRKKFVLIIAAIVAGVFFLRKYIKTYHGGLQFERFVFSLPKFGQIFRLIIVERFTAQMSLLIESGVPIIYSLDIAQKLVSNRICALVIEDMKDGVKQGQLLVDPMKRSGFFPPMAIQMIMVGEETGELSQMMNHVAAYFKRNVEVTVERFATLIEPLTILFMGGVIGIILIAMFLPLFNIGTLGGSG